MEHEMFVIRNTEHGNLFWDCRGPRRRSGLNVYPPINAGNPTGTYPGWGFEPTQYESEDEARAAMKEAGIWDGTVIPVPENWEDIGVGVS
jgi:hypothetical protein